jgi:hypothetical protein
VVLREATQMGQTLASIDPSVVPMLEDAHEYTSYIQFIMAHRYKLSRLPFMEPWEERLQGMIEMEATLHGLKLEDPTDWDHIEKQISMPIHCAFWYGWEQVRNLAFRYEQCVAERRRAQGASMAIAIAPDAPAEADQALHDAPPAPALDGAPAASPIPHH